MEKEVKELILSVLFAYYGSDNVSEDNEKIYVSNNNGACEISIRYEE